MFKITKEIIEQVKGKYSEGFQIGAIGWEYCHDKNGMPNCFLDRADIAYDIIQGKYDDLLEK